MNYTQASRAELQAELQQLKRNTRPIAREICLWIFPVVSPAKSSLTCLPIC